MNLIDRARQVLSTVAPVLGTAVGGPFGAIAGSVISAALGTKPGDDKAAQAALLAANPDALVKLKQAEMDFQSKMKELGIAEEKLTFDDLASARQMQIATKDPTASRLAWLVVGGFLLISSFECIAMVLWPAKWGAIPGAALNLLGIIFGFLANEAKQAGAFYFGSTSGSQAKDATLAEIAKS